METFRHERPTLAHQTQAKELVNEFLAHNSAMNGQGELQHHVDDYPGWLDYLATQRELPVTEARVPAETFFLIRESDHKLVGCINIRLALNENLKKFGGHIGYSIRPTERGKGYNKVNLYLGLLFCQKCGIKNVFMDCAKNNPASARTIQALGGEFLREYEDTTHGYGTVLDYNIAVDAAIEKYRPIYQPQINQNALLSPSAHQQAMTTNILH